MVSVSSILVRGNSVEEDINTRASQVQYLVCKICSRELKRFNQGKYPNGRDYKYINEDGRQWNGRSCPDCHSASVAAKSKSIRDRKKLYV